MLVIFVASLLNVHIVLRHLILRDLRIVLLLVFEGHFRLLHRFVFTLEERLDVLFAKEDASLDLLDVEILLYDPVHVLEVLGAE